MRKKLRITALLWVLVFVCIWLVCGHNPGWTQNKVFIPIHDPVTGIDGSVEQQKFIPGVDFLAIGLGLAALQFGSSFIVRKEA